MMALFLVLVILAALSILRVDIYRMFYHKLSKFPGPTLWAISQLPQAYYLFKGCLPYKILELHNRYGPVVRLAPNELSFITADAWNDIYGKPSKKPQLQKEHTFLPPSTGISGIIFETDDTEHSRLRRVFSHAFSDKSLRDQEATVLKYVDQLIIKLQENATDSLDMCKWLNFVCFDITGELMFSESFDSLNKPDFRPWIKIFYNWVAGAALLSMGQKLWPLTSIVKWLVPKDMRDAEVSHRIMTQEILEKRLRTTNAFHVDLYVIHF
ncbi:hypothetical protein ONS96_009403 [Cadophora gregata f. sp. sojae]|nr:hypothetical protein ONS96_009403 [Cadophora gregata f. sp. sojae]